MNAERPGRPVLWLVILGVQLSIGLAAVLIFRGLREDARKRVDSLESQKERIAAIVEGSGEVRSPFLDAWMRSPHAARGHSTPVAEDDLYRIVADIASRRRVSINQGRIQRGRTIPQGGMEEVYAEFPIEGEIEARDLVPFLRALESATFDARPLGARVVSLPRVDRIGERSFRNVRVRYVVRQPHSE